MYTLYTLYVLIVLFIPLFIERRFWFRHIYVSIPVDEFAHFSVNDFFFSSCFHCKNGGEHWRKRSPYIDGGGVMCVYNFLYYISFHVFELSGACKMMTYGYAIIYACYSWRNMCWNGTETCYDFIRERVRESNLCSKKETIGKMMPFFRCSMTVSSRSTRTYYLYYTLPIWRRSIWNVFSYKTIQFNR